jgi:cytochrome bd-type quinol oxidase subunit 2
MQLGAALIHTLPRFNHEPVGKLFTPVWEVANVFLVLAFALFAIVFRHATSTLYHSAWGLGLLALDALVIRACLITRPKVPAGMNAANILLVLSCLITPVLFSATGIPLLTGDVFWHSSTGWVLLGLLVLTQLMLAVGFVYYRAGRHATNKLRWASRLFVFTYAAVVAIDLQAAVTHMSPHLSSLPYALFVMLVACSILWEMALLTTKRSDRAMWWYMSGVVAIAPLLLALANRPWLMYGRYTLAQGYVGGAVGATAVFGGFVLLVVFTGSVGTLVSRMVRLAR